MIDADAPGRVVQRLPEGDIQVAGKAGFDAGLGHGHIAHGIDALLAAQCGHLGAALQHLDHGLGGRIVGALQPVDPDQFEAVIGEFDRLARRHALVDIHTVQAGQGDADDRHREADVGQRHAIKAARHLREMPEFMPPVAQAFTEAGQRGEDDPGRGYEAEHGFEPVILIKHEAEQQAEREAGPGQITQLPPHAPIVILPPARPGPDADQQDDGDHERDEHGVEIGWADRELALAERLNKQRIEGAEQHGQHGHHHEDAVQQQEGLARDEPEAAAVVRGGRAERVQEQRAADIDAEQREDEDAARGVGGKGMHRGDHARAHQKCAEQAERKGADGQQYGPVLEHIPLFGRRERMDQGRADQPGHEGGVFHRVPEPPAAPAELVIGPPAAKRDADGQKHPGQDRPGPRPSGPGGVQPATEQGGDGKAKRHGKADIAHIKHRRMDDQPRVLQQRIQIIAIRRDREQPLKRVGGEQHKQQKADADRAHDADHPGQKRQRQAPAVKGHGDGPAGQHQRPQQQRTLMRAPHRREAVHKRQHGVGIVRDIGDREVIHNEAPGQDAERERHEEELQASRGPGQRHPGDIAALCPPDREYRLDDGHRQRQDQRELSELRGHGW